MEYLTSLPEYLLSIVQKTDFSDVSNCKVNFHWGNQNELNKYLHSTQDDVFGKMLMSGAVESQYPLIWLVKGYDFYPHDISEVLYDFDKVNIFFLVKTDMSWLNKRRWKNNMHKLYGIGHLLKESLKRDRFSDLVGNNYKWEEDDQISLKKDTQNGGDKSSTIDFCDGLILKIDKLRINTDCFNYLSVKC